MNILILSNGIVEKNLVKLCQQSQYLEKLFVSSQEEYKDVVNIDFSDYDVLMRKIKSLHVDIVILSDVKLIKEGFVELCNKNKINIFSVNQKWFNLEKSRLVAKKLTEYYSINNPVQIKAPTTFPLVIKTDLPPKAKIAKSMNELVEIMQEFAGHKFFLEEYLTGEELYLLSLWDGKTLLHFDKTIDLNEVQRDRLELYKTKLNFLFADEKPNFIGFFMTKLIWAKNDWYLSEYIMHLDEMTDFNAINIDFPYLLNSAIYQKLNEISY